MWCSTNGTFHLPDLFDNSFVFKNYPQRMPVRLSGAAIHLIGEKVMGVMR